MKRKPSVILALVLMIFYLSGCAKCIDTQCSTVDVKIVDEYYQSMYITPIRCGKTTTMITHPAVYEITVEYNGVDYVICGSDTYEKYSDKIGDVASGTLETKSYDDGTVRYNIKELN
nr:MAG TPA: peptidylprolyl isomerase [Caudoviricetes sp.]